MGDQSSHGRMNEHRGAVLVQYQLDVSEEKEEETGRAVGTVTGVNTTVSAWGPEAPAEELVQVWTSGIAGWAEEAGVEPSEILADLASALCFGGGDPSALLLEAYSCYEEEGGS